MRVVLKDTEDTWTSHLPQQRQHLRTADAGAVLATPPTRRAASGSRRWARSTAPAIARSISTPRSSRSSIERFGAPGDFAQAYVIAHEVGHHVQNLLGLVGARATRAPAREARRGQPALSVRLELQADCYAGVWGHYAAQHDLLRTGRRRRGAAGRGGDWRRSAAAADAGPRGAGVVHARVVRAARARGCGAASKAARWTAATRFGRLVGRVRRTGGDGSLSPQTTYVRRGLQTALPKPERPKPEVR